MRENSFLSDAQVNKIDQKVNDELSRVLESIDPAVGAMEKDELRDTVDEANSNIQASHDLRMKNRELFYYKKLNQTLRRIEKGTVGICKECDGEINYERIMARPTAEMCISCKEESEMAEKNNFFARKSKSLGKTLDEITVR
jgi:DnaK suppressor protein